jgi:UDP-N-acetylglucosamine/UDP-N-acetylgalactosamine diphosphorylase
MSHDIAELKKNAAAFGQDHIFRFWEELDGAQKETLAAQVASIDFPLMKRLIDKWILSEPKAETFDKIEPVAALPIPNEDDPKAQEARDAGEAALRAGRVGLFLVAGGQGTRLGFDGPKGAYPVGPVTGKTLFHYHAEKIRAVQDRYGCTLPWYIMVSATNEEPTREFFRENDFFGLNEGDIMFLQQDMVPCVDDSGKLMLAEKGELAMNPNGHGGCLPAMVERGVLADCRRRGVDVLSYFQVDNWAINLADPYFIGYHVLNNAEMASKIHRKREPRESVGVHCVCDGVYHVIEYSELDIYPQLLETDDNGDVVYYAGNPAIHTFSVDFVQRVYDHFEEFPWHRAHKKIPCVNQSGEPVKPDEPNGYKFETFVFDALQRTHHDPVALEIRASGEYTPIKQFDGANSVVAARHSQNDRWASWLEAAGHNVPRDNDGRPTINIEISPLFALDKAAFLTKAEGINLDTTQDLAIHADGKVVQSAPST